mgnify:CR=1 FL=1
MPLTQCKGGENMEIIIVAEPKEIAALVVAIQERQEEFTPSHGHGVERGETIRTNSPGSTPTPLQSTNR